MKFRTHSFHLLVLAFFVGCGDSGKLPTLPVTGSVSYNGKPVVGATVVFSPSSGQPHSATGITNESGVFSLTTYSANDGAVEGSYKVAISKNETSGGMSADEEHAAISAGQSVREAQTSNVLPARYASAATSNLTAEINSSGNSRFDFELKD